MTKTPLSRRKAFASFATIVLVLSATAAGIPLVDGGVRAANVANQIPVGTQSPEPTATTQSGGCRVIDDSGTHVLDGNVSADSDTFLVDDICILVTASDVVLDGQGHRIEGNDFGTAIRVANRSNVTVRNLEVENVGVGIEYRNVSDSHVAAVTTVGTVTGLELVDTAGTTVTRSTFTDSDVGVGVGTSSTPLLSGLRITDSRHAGIDAVDTEGAWTVRNVTVEDGNDVGINATRSTGDWTVTESLVAGAGTGIAAAESTGDWAVRNTTVADNEARGLDAREAAGRWILNGVRAANNTVSIDARRATGPWEMLNSHVVNNSEYGVSVTETAGEWSVLGSTVANNAVGIEGDYVERRARIGFNTIRKNGVGIRISESDEPFDATRNWWGQPSGPIGDQCVGSGNCSDPLDAPSTVTIPELVVGFTATNATADSGLELLFDGTAVGPDDVIESYAWEFGDGTGATGETVVNAYESPDAYRVNYTVTGRYGRTVTESREVVATTTVGAPVVVDVTSTLGGPIPEQANVSATYTVRTVAQGAAVDAVTFEYEGRTYDATKVGENRWRRTIAFGERTDDGTVRITASNADGSDTVVAHVGVVDFPTWIDELRAGGGTTVNGKTGEVTIGKQVPDPPIDVSANLKVPVAGGKQKFRADVVYGISYNTRRAAAKPSVTGIIDGQLAGRRANGKLGAGGVLVAESAPGSTETRWRLRNATAFADVRMDALVKKWRPKVKYSPSVTIRVGPRFRLDLYFVVVDDSLKITNSRLAPGIFAVGKLSWKSGPASITGIAKGEAGGFFYIPSGTPGLEAAIEFIGKLKLWGFKGTVSYGPLTATSASSNARTLQELATAPRVDGWELRDPMGPGPFDARDGVVTAGATTATGATAESVVQAPSASTTIGNVTNDDVDDRSPALAATPDGHTLVWTRPSPADLDGVDDGTAGDEIYASQFDPDARSWSNATRLTTDRRMDTRPSLAVGSQGDHLAVWTVVDEPLDDLTDPDDAMPVTEIAYATGDGANWSAPARLTTDSTPDFGPQVAYGDGVALVAWETDTDGDSSTRSDRAIRYATYDEGFGPVRTIEDGRAPVVSGRADGAITLSYFDPEEEEPENGSVVVGRVAGGSFTEEDRYDATAFLDATVDGDSLVWVDGPTNASTLHYVSRPGATPSRIDPTRHTVDVRDLNLVSDGTVEVLTYSGNRPGSDVENEQVYLVNRGNGWIYDHIVADSDRPLSFWQASTAAREDGFLSVFMATNVDPNVTGTSDLVYATHDFRPDLAVNATVNETNVTVGDTVTVNYTVRNVGDLNVTDDIRVTVTNGSGLVVGETLAGPLVPGANVTRSAEVTVDETGRLSVATESTKLRPELTRANNVVNLTLVHPDLTVRTVSERREGETLLVNATLANEGSVAASTVTYQFADGSRQRGTGTLPALPPGANRSVTVAVNASDLDPATTNVVRVDHTETIPETDETNNALAFRSLQPDLVVQDGGTRYVSGTCGLAAEVWVGNRGTGEGEATVRVTNPEGTTTFGTRTVTVPAAARSGTTAFTRVVVPLTGVTEGASVRVTADTGFDRESADNSVLDELVVGEADVNAAPLVSVTASTTTPQAGERVAFDAIESCDPDGEVVRYEWDFDDDGSTDAMGPTVAHRFRPVGETTTVLRVTDDLGVTSVRRVDLTVQQGGARTLRLSDATGTEGQNVTVTLSTDALDVAGYRTNVTFDPAVVQVVNVTDELGSDAQAAVRNDRGWVTLRGTTGTGRDAPDLATLTVRIVSSEATVTSLSAVEAETGIEDSQGDPVELAGVEDGQITVTAAPTPTPAAGGGGGFQFPTATAKPEPTLPAGPTATPAPTTTAAPPATPESTPEVETAAPTADRAQSTATATPLPTEPAGFDPRPLAGLALLLLAVLGIWWYRRK